VRDHYAQVVLTNKLNHSRSHWQSRIPGWHPFCGGLRVSLEAGTTLGWERFTGSSGLNLGVDRFGA